MALTTQRPLVWPVVTQHMEDAAFCWLRRNDAHWLPLMRAEHLQRIDRQLDAHLCGLRIAGAAVLPRALTRLERWKTADEVFVCTYIGLQLGGGAEHFSRVEELLLEDEDLAPGAAAALLWVDTATALPLLQRWWHSGQPALRRAALPAALRHPQVNRENAVLDCLDTSYAPLQARALRAIGEWGLRQQQPALEAALRATEPRCRLEAAYSLRLFGHDVVVQDLPQYLEPLAMPTRRRLLMSAAANASAARCADTYAALVQAGQQRDTLWLQIFRGDATALAHLTAALDGDHAVLAAYGIEHITGVGLDDNGCWQRPDPMEPVSLKPAGGDEHEHAAPDEDDPEMRVHAEDSGLLSPLVEPLRAWLAVQPAPSGRQLAGVPVEIAVLQLAGSPALTLPQCRQLAFQRALQGQPGAIDASFAPIP